MSSAQIKIARKARVSQSTVSRALSNHPSLPESTRQRVQAVARQLGYAPNPLVSSVFGAMRRRVARTNLGMLAFLTAHGTRDGWSLVPTFRDFYQGAHGRATELGFALEAHWAAEPGLTGARLSDILQARGIVGVLISIRGSRESFPPLFWEKFALVRIGLSQGPLPFHSAVNHQYRTVRMVVDRLRQRGYQRIGLALSTWQNSVTEQNWLGGFLGWQERLPRTQRVPAHIAETLEPGPFLGWFRKQRPDCVVSVNPDPLRWLRAEGLRVPEDAAVALLDWHADYGDVAGADQNNPRVGSAAVDLLLSQLQRNEFGLPLYPQTLMIDSTWREGATVRPLAVQA